MKGSKVGEKLTRAGFGVSESVIRGGLQSKAVHFTLYLCIHIYSIYIYVYPYLSTSAGGSYFFNLFFISHFCNFSTGWLLRKENKRKRVRRDERRSCRWRCGLFGLAEIKRGGSLESFLEKLVGRASLRLSSPSPPSFLSHCSLTRAEYPLSPGPALFRNDLVPPASPLASMDRVLSIREITQQTLRSTRSR